MISTIFLAMLVQAAPPEPPAPRVPPPRVNVTTVPSPPPIITAPIAPPMMMPYGNYDRPNATVRVRITAGKTRLLEDSFKVGRTLAMFNQNRSEAVEQACATTYNQSVRSSLNFGLRPEGTTANAYRLNFGWSRPTTGCAAEGSLTVSIDQAVMLNPGQSLTVEGDGGVRIELSRL